MLFAPRRRIAAWVLGVAVIAACLWPAPAAGPRVVLRKPGPQTYLIGQQTVEFAVEGAPADSIARAAVLLDGREVGALTAPPFSLSIDAGDDLAPRRLDVVVTLKDGRKFKTGLTSPRSPGTEVVVRMVTLSVTVTDHSGKTVTDLGRGDFQVFDSGQAVELAHWEATPASLAVAFVLDTSLTMQGDKLAEAQHAATAFVKELAPEDAVSVLSFSDEVRERAPLGGDHARALREIDALSAGGGTALYDAVYAAASALKSARPEARRVIVLLSDGRDEAASGLEPGSFHTQDEAIHQAHFADATIFALGLGAELDRETDFTGRMTTAEVLGRFSRSTGGVFQKITRWSRLERAFRGVLDEIRRQYGMAYRPPSPKPGESWRTVQVKVSRPGLSVRTREGYFVD